MLGGRAEKCLVQCREVTRGCFIVGFDIAIIVGGENGS